MTDLDVALRLRLINMMSGGVGEAVDDLKRIATAGKEVNRLIDSGKPVPAQLWRKAAQEAAAAGAASTESWINSQRAAATASADSAASIVASNAKIVASERETVAAVQASAKDQAAAVESLARQRQKAVE